MNKIDNFAPVYIPTLNRYEHFKRCLESLERCTGADKTEVYVGLDFPPSERYVEGWRKIDAYLAEKERSNGFKSLYVRRRDHNCGIGNPSSNAALLLKEIRERYDRYISSEDDNEFSPNFLEYVNQGLEKYKNDKNCTAICGYNYIGMNLTCRKENVYLSREYAAWGVGHWTDRREEAIRYTTITYAKEIMSSWKKVMIIFRHEPRLLNTVLLNIAINRPFGDTMRVCYQYLENKYSVFPRISKVRNHGFDGTGTSIFGRNSEFATQTIDNDKVFQMDNIEAYVCEDVQNELEKLKWFRRPWYENVVIFVRVFIYWLTKLDILYFEQKRRNKSLFK